MSLLSWSVILLINEAAPIQWRKKMRLMSNQVDISSLIFHSSHSKGTQKQLLSRIILAQRPCHIAIKAFCSILTIAVCRCTIITLLLDFEVLIYILDKDFNLNIWLAFLLYERHFPFTCVICLNSFRFFHSSKFANGALMWFSLGFISEVTSISGHFVILFKMKFRKIQL